MAVIFILLCLLTFLSYSLFFKTRKDSRGFTLPPSPPSLPIIGHLHLLISSQPHKCLQRLASKYGPLLHIRIFHFPGVLVSSASMANEMFTAHDMKVSSRGVTAIDESLYLGSSGIIYAPYGDYLKYLKKLMVGKLLGPQFLGQSRGIRAEELQRFYENIQDKARKNEIVELRKGTKKFMTNALCRMSMGRIFSEGDGEAERMEGFVEELFGLSTKAALENIFHPVLEKLRIPLFKKEIMAASTRFDEEIEKILVKHEEKLSSNKEYLHGMDMMDVLLEASKNENAEYKLTRKQIKSFLTELFVGGTDNSIRSTQWTMAEILNNPSIFERLREEIDYVVGKSRLIQETDIPNLLYLQAVVKEGLRMYPTTPILVREVQERCEIQGFYISENTTLVVNLYAIMRDPDSWEDPNEFKPERFLDSKKKEQELNYLPFCRGRRSCPGSNLANIFIEMAIGMMVQCFDWKIKDGNVNVEETFKNMGVSMLHPLKCTPTLRPLEF